MHLTSIDDAAWASPWRHRPVADKALLSLGLVVTALCLPPLPTGVLVALVAAGCLLGPARIPGRALGHALGPPLTVVLLGALPVAVALGDPPGDAWAWGPLWVGPVSARQALDLAVHGVAGSLALLVLAMTTPLVDLLGAARSLRVPDACLDVAALTYRLLFVVLDTATTIAHAQRGRLGDSPARRRGRSRVRARFDTVGALTTATLLRSWARARRMSDGLAGRGYDCALVTLPVARPRSARFEIATGVVLVSVWVASWAGSAALAGPGPWR